MRWILSLTVVVSVLGGLDGSRARAAEAGRLTPFEIIDRYALAAPESAAESTATLAAYLVKPARNPWEKVRAIFRWIAGHIDYDIDSLIHERPVSTDPEIILQRRKAVCGGYSKLFAALCREAGIEVEIVIGKSREYDEESDELLRRLFGGAVNHAWNVVKLGGQWLPLDVTWAAGTLDGQRQFVRRFDPHYFLTRPVEFIHTHYPVEPKWQLLLRPVERADYDQLVQVRSGFFRDGLTLMSHRLMNIAAAGSVKILLGAPEGVTLAAVVTRQGKELPDTRTLVQRRGLMYEVHACFPETGDYLLRIFSMRERGEKRDPFRWALGYKVRVTTAATEFSGYPTLYAGFVEHEACVTMPLTSRLQGNSVQNFAVTVPGAEKVFLKSGGDIVWLQGGGNQFSGSATVVPGELNVFAVFPGNGAEAVGLLKYAVE